MHRHPVRSHPSIAVFLVAAGILALACGSDQATEPEPTDNEEDEAPSTGGLSVSVAATPDTVSPGDTAFAIVEASPMDRLDQLTLTVDGVISGTVTLPKSSRIVVGVDVPTGHVEGMLAFTVTASNAWGSAAASDTVTVHDIVPPTASLSLRTAVQPGSSLDVTLSAHDNGTVTRTVLTASGAVSAADTMDHSAIITSHELSIEIPDDVAMGDSVIVQALVQDFSGLTATARSRVSVTDIWAPAVTARVEPNGFETHPNGLELYVPGDTIRLTITAQDDRRLAWIGFECPGASYGVRDSVAAGGTADSASFEIVVGDGWESDWYGIDVFARDSVGNRNDGVARVALFDGIRREYERVVGHYIGLITDMAYDPKRNLLYMSQADSLRIAVLSLSDLSFQTYIRSEEPPAGLDLTLSGDSLLIALLESPYVGVIDLTQPQLFVDTLRLEYLNHPQRAPTDVKIAANNKAFFSLENRAGQFDSTGYMVDLGTGEQRLLAEIGWPSPIARSGDRSVVVYLVQADAVIYHVSNDEFQSLRVYLDGSPIVNYSGDHVLLRTVLYDIQFNRVLDLAEGFWPAPQIRPSFSSNGTTAFIALKDELGYRELSVPDGAPVSRVVLPFFLDGFLAVSEEQLLVFCGLGAPCAVVDLGS